MGGANDKGRKIELDFKIDTDSMRYDKREVQELYKQFKKETSTSNGEPVINKKEFSEVMRAMLITDPFLQDLIFNAFDSNRDGVITFQEFVKGLSVMTKGSPEEKLAFCFSMYDHNGKGYITREDIQTLVTALYPLCGPLSSYSGKKFDSPAQLVDEFFDELDEDATGKISLEQYKEACMKHTDIFPALKLNVNGMPPK